MSSDPRSLPQAALQHKPPFQTSPNQVPGRKAATHLQQKLETENAAVQCDESD